MMENRECEHFCADNDWYVAIVSGVSGVTVNVCPAPAFPILSDCFGSNSDLYFFSALFLLFSEIIDEKCSLRVYVALSLSLSLSLSLWDCKRKEYLENICDNRLDVRANHSGILFYSSLVLMATNIIITLIYWIDCVD